MCCVWLNKITYYIAKYKGMASIRKKNYLVELQGWQFNGCDKIWFWSLVWNWTGSKYNMIVNFDWHGAGSSSSTNTQNSVAVKKPVTCLCCICPLGFFLSVCQLNSFFELLSCYERLEKNIHNIDRVYINLSSDK
jgi:hypothetical protein